MNLSDPADRLLIDHLRRRSAASVSELMDLLGVTATAVRQRLNRLMADGLIGRQLDRPTDGEATGRGRPSYRYSLTERGRSGAGDNYQDLAQAMWQEIRSIPDPAIRAGAVKRVANRLAERYSPSIDGEDLKQRMLEMTRLLGEREVPVELDESSGLPVLTLLACPYPKLAENDRTVCAMEKVLLSEVLGEAVRLSECRLDGGGCCSFTPSRGDRRREPTESLPKVTLSDDLHATDGTAGAVEIVLAEEAVR
ncbi:helix-turn-helix transcriptional regulator [Botrimarina hoheduenensis]|nr:winged helix-turn-helix transcriptional regulator [Botrimarina hoheduenensis]